MDVTKFFAGFASLLIANSTLECIFQMVISENYIQIFKQFFSPYSYPQGQQHELWLYWDSQMRAERKKNRTLIQIFIRTKDFKASVREM